MGEPEPTKTAAFPPRFYRPELDALRFLAFLLIFVHHALRTASLGSLLMARDPGREVQALSHALDLVQDTGNFGMCLFFVLSAFLITELLLREQEYTGRIDTGAFYMRRILRIWPLYLGFLAFITFLGRIDPVHFHVTGGQFLAYLFLAGNWYNSLFAFFPASLAVLWSISIEEQFYLVWPNLVRVGKGRNGVIFGVILFSATSCTAMVWLGMRGRDEEVFWYNSFVQFLFFAAGAAFALWTHKRGVPRFSRGLRVTLFLVAFAIWAACEARFGLRHRDTTLYPLQALTGYFLIAIGTVLMFLSFLGTHSNRIPLWLRTLGKVSYGLYIFHELCLFLTSYSLSKLSHALQLHGHSLIAMKLAVAPTALALTVLFALSSYRYFESPFLRLRGKFTIITSRPL